MRSMGMLFIEAARILIQVQDDRLGEGEMIDVEVEKEEEESVYVQGNKVNKSRPSWEELLQRLARMAHGEGAGHPGLMSALKQRIGQSLYLQTRGGVQLQAALVAITADKTEEAVEVCDTEENDETLVNYWSERLIEYMDLGNGTSSARGSDEFFGAGQRQHADNHLADPGHPAINMDCWNASARNWMERNVKLKLSSNTDNTKKTRSGNKSKLCTRLTGRRPTGTGKTGSS